MLAPERRAGFTESQCRNAAVRSPDGTRGPALQRAKDRSVGVSRWIVKSGPITSVADLLKTGHVPTHLRHRWAGDSGVGYTPSVIGSARQRRQPSGLAAERPDHGSLHDV